MTLRRITLALLALYALLTVYSVLGRPLVQAAPLVGSAFALLHARQAGCLA